ncbi:methylenetetrahydrofolate reductase [Brucella intermedia]|uniref:methylenetetrahydrofolate reductase n=1 Tax=Brucella intermedia TaxID=94625 RepID=UPI00224937E6|nr:methylenetetrahydrofolate reductase [Brucella intermedia]
MHPIKSHPVCALPASIEILPREIPTSEQLRALLPSGTLVYLADVGAPRTNAEMLAAAQRIQEAGCIPVPHLAARRIKSREALEKRIKELAELAGVNNFLLVGGGVATPLGPYKSTMDILETGVFDRFGIKDIAVAGHPEESPDFTEAVAIEALKQKQTFAERTGARLRIVTQFSFDPARVLKWAESLAKMGIDLPVHIGVAGPTRFATLTRYATACGVGNSLSMLTKSAGNIMSLATGYSSETFVLPIEKELKTLVRPTIAQIHVFPFGGLENTSSWLRRRGSW